MKINTIESGLFSETEMDAEGIKKLIGNHILSGCEVAKNGDLEHFHVDADCIDDTDKGRVKFNFDTLPGGAPYQVAFLEIESQDGSVCELPLGQFEFVYNEAGNGFEDHVRIKKSA